MIIQVVVNVTNLLENEATSLHFHGMEQSNTPWMDGAGGISHCPINPLESFQYRYLSIQFIVKCETIHDQCTVSTVIYK